MATYTDKLNLKLPAQTDFYNVDDFNDNFEKIDENVAIGEDIQRVLLLADPIRSNRAPIASDAQYAGKIWVIPKIIFNNMMPNALAQVASNWIRTASTASVSGTSITFVGNGSANNVTAVANMTAVRANDKVYVAATMAVTADTNSAVIELLCGDEVIASTSMSTPVAGDNVRFISYVDIEDAGVLKLRVTTMYNSSAVQLGKGVTVSDITVLDLTADMCQNFDGIEFTKTETTNYINTYGNFQTKTYELSEYWWICRGSYGSQYSWQRYDDYTNAVMDEYSTNYQNSKATQAEAQAGSDDTHWMTPLKTQQFLTNKIATQSEAETGSNNTKMMTPLRTSQAISKKITDQIATQSEAETGSNNTKIMTPLRVKNAMNAHKLYRSLAVGDIFHSANNIEAETNGSLIKCDGRIIDTASGYPLLANTYELKHMIAQPTELSASSIQCDPYSSKSSVFLSNGYYFFIATYAESRSSSYVYSLCCRNTNGTITRLLSNSVFGIVESNGYVIACASGNQTVRAVVYSSTGSQIRNIQLYNDSNYDARIIKFGNLVVIVAQYNGQIRMYYSSNNFATYGVSTFAGAQYLSGYMGGNFEGYGANDICGNMIHKHTDGYYYMLIYKNTNPNTFEMWKSTDNCASWTKLWTITSSSGSTAGTYMPESAAQWFIDGTYVYMAGRIYQASGSNIYVYQIILKYNLSNGAYVSKTAQLTNSANNSIKYLFGFLQSGYAYIMNEHVSVKVNLSNMSHEAWTPFGSGSNNRLRTNCKSYLASNGKYWIAYADYLYDRNSDSTRYGIIYIYDTEAHRAKVLTGSLYVSSNSHCYLGSPAEYNNVIYIPQGYYSDNWLYTKIIKIDLNKIELPILDFAYIKAKEVQ